jgi:hypothetical protein
MNDTRAPARGNIEASIDDMEMASKRAGQTMYFSW